jgi:hypothetical protein
MPMGRSSELVRVATRRFNDVVVGLGILNEPAVPLRATSLPIDGLFYTQLDHSQEWGSSCFNQL